MGFSTNHKFFNPVGRGQKRARWMDRKKAGNLESYKLRFTKEWKQMPCQEREEMKMGETAAGGGRSSFPAFPYEPYPIQLDFMNALYDALDRGGVAMLESPTGTGKTLSMICSALQWVVDQKHKPKCRISSGGDSDGEPDWMRDFEEKKPASDAVEAKAKNVAKFESKKVKDFGMLSSSDEPRGVEEGREDFVKKRSGALKLDDDEEFLLEEYESEEELTQSKRKACGPESSSDEDGCDKEEVEVTPKVYFCSRTHSQLSQFVEELKKTKFHMELSVVCLGSRKTLCINQDVSKLRNSTQINEMCLQLQQCKSKVIKLKNNENRIRRTKKASGCPMLRKRKLQKQFIQEAAELGVLDIEDLMQLGTRIGACPYYGSRNMVPAANLVVVPYQSVLLKSSRESLGLNLKDSIVIIDEAHNLADSLTNMYNCVITLSQFKRIHSLLEAYLEKFQNQLGACNRRYIQTLMVLAHAFIQLLQQNASIQNTSGDGASESSMTVNELLFSLDIDNINLVKLRRYIIESRIAHKVSGYGTFIAAMQNGSRLSDVGFNEEEGSVLHSFQSLVDFLFALTNSDNDGRVLVSKKVSLEQKEERRLKYVMLSGEKLFQEIVDQARAVVLAGGTLQPIEEARERLFPSLTSEKFHPFSCNHIVPPENIISIAVSKGPTGVSFDFSYNSRSSLCMIEELGRLLCNLAGIIPEGVVLFFSSFDYEEQVYNAWKSSGILSRILKKKKVFREPRNNTEVETVLKQYKEVLSCNCDSREDQRHNGALLLAVVGGKMSEGINFSDGMGRCVVMVGLPYPSPDVELLERIKHIEGQKTHAKLTKPISEELRTNGEVHSGFEILRRCSGKGREYYENLTMKAVNQSVGRAIRHIGDYAAILLVDSRYASNSSKSSISHPTNKLPQWIKNRLVSNPRDYGEVHKLLHQFFRLHKQKKCAQA